MNKSRFSEEQIIGVSAEVDAGMKVADLFCRRRESDSTRLTNYYIIIILNKLAMSFLNFKLQH